MTALLLAGVLLAGLAFALAHVIRNDGYGQRPPPRSHHDDLDRWSAGHRA